MKKILRIISFILILVMLASIISCSSNPSSEQDNTPADTTDKNNDSANNNNDNGNDKNDNGGGTDEQPANELKSPVPDDLDFDGEKVRFYCYFAETGTDGSKDPVKTTIMEADTGDVVIDSIYRRNMEVQEKFGVTFEFTYSPPNADDTTNNNLISKSINAGLNEYDIVIGNQYQCVQLTTNEMFRNIKNLPYLDIKNPWWATKYIDDITIGNDVLMFVTGDISLGWLQKLSTMYFNKELYTQNFGSPDDMYQLVLDGKWTLDELDSMAKVMYKDLNGDGNIDETDQFGLITHPISLTDHFTYASGIRATDRDENGIPYLIFNNEKTINYTQKLYDIYYNNTGTQVVQFSHPNFDNIFNDKFSANEVLFRPDLLINSERLRSMQTDFGMIPYPKLDESTASYSALVHDTAPLMCVPSTCDKDELVGAVLEEMAFKGYMYMTPAFFDVALKNKYMRDSDDKAMQCLELIRSNSVTDFAYVYNYAINGIGLIMRDLMGKKSTDFVSAYEKIEEKANNSLQKIIDAYFN